MTQFEIACIWAEVLITTKSFSFWEGKELLDGSVVARINDEFISTCGEIKPLQYYLLPCYTEDEFAELCERLVRC